MSFNIKSVATMTIQFEDYIYFNSREENRMKETLPVLHNIALQYALKNVQVPSYRLYSFVPSYIDDFKTMKNPFYIYPALPATIDHRGASGISVRSASPETSIMKIGWQTDDYRSFSEQTRVNLLQFSDIKVLDPGNTFITFVTSSLPFDQLARCIPSIIRIGKFNSKASIAVKETEFYPVRATDDIKRMACDWIVNPIDLPSGLKIGRDYVASLLRMNPNDLLRDVTFTRPVPAIRLKNAGNITIPICYHFQGVNAS